MTTAKKIATIFVGTVLLIVLCAQALASVYTASPNYAEHTGSYPEFSGYIQCRPSYNQNGKHAQAGYIRFYSINSSGGKFRDTGKMYTDCGIDQNDSRLLTRSEDYDVPTGATKVEFQYGFVWQTHHDDGPAPWPALFSIGDVAE